MDFYLLRFFFVKRGKAPFVRFQETEQDCLREGGAWTREQRASRCIP